MEATFRSRNTQRSRALRREAPPAERRLWAALSNRKVEGAHFTRQYQVGPYFCDFTCRSQHLIVEVDGYSHDMRIAYDQARDEYLRAQGFRILRFKNADVLGNLEGVVEMIAEALGPSPDPSRTREGSR